MAEEIANRLLKKQTLCAELLVTYRTLECGSLLPTSFEMGSLLLTTVWARLTDL